MTHQRTPDLGRLTTLNPRDVWRHEAHNFTPWLLGNVDVLSDLLGMELALDVAEHPVGSFSLDLMGRDLTSGEVVIVENQLEPTDHGHLGQILTYAAGTEPATVVWIASSFRPEHRAALDWLNARTDDQTRFFGVELRVVRIGQSQPAPDFKLVAQPNDWEKTVRASARSELSSRERAYSEFWRLWLDRLAEESLPWSRATRMPRGSAFAMPTGTSNVSYYCYFMGGRLGSEIDFEDPDPATNDARLRALEARKADIEAAYGGPLDWQEMKGRKATRIADYLPDSVIDDTNRWEEYLTWLLERQRRLRRAITSVGGVPTDLA